jgi:glutathione synthase/RimK-type ligase-like ATP-grasp enzyme
MGIDVEKIKRYMQEIMPAASVKIISFENLPESLGDVHANACLFYTSSYDPSYRKYITNVIFHVSRLRPDIVLIPDLDMLMSFEDKGYQEFLKKRLGIEELKGHFFGDIADFPKERFRRFPYVLKMLDGSVSSNVFLVNNHEELEKILKKKTIIPLRYRLKKKWRLYKTKNMPEILAKYPFAVNNYERFFTVRTPFVLQEFVPGLEGDYKVLIFGHKYYVLKRYVRKNDFRASGSGKFEYETPSKELLQYARAVYKKFNVPFISLDIAEKDNEYFLIEYQGIAFGPLTLEDSKGYYSTNETINNGSWQFNEETPDLEREYALSVISFIKAHVKEIGKN